MGVVSEAMRAFMDGVKTMATKESNEKAMNFKPRPDDVIVVTPAKSGTSWIQQICHGLRSGGSMDFENLLLVFPFIEMARDYGYIDLEQEQVASPRMYMTHYDYPVCPKGAGKYVYVVRDPKDAAVSGYHFFSSWLLEGDSVSIEDFIRRVFIRRGAIGPVHDSTNWESIASWYRHRNDDNVLWLHFEDLKEDLAACVKLIAEFLDIGSKDEELQALVTKQATLDFMKQHQKKFDIDIITKAQSEAVGIAFDAETVDGVRKIRTGKTGDAKKVLPQNVLDELDTIWKEDMEPVTGYASYQELRSGVNKELGRSFASAS